MNAPSPAPAVTPKPPRSTWRARALALLLGLALAALTLWTAVYFWLGSSPGRAQLLSLADLPAGVSVRAVRWGPAPDSLALGALTVSDPTGRELAHVTSASFDLGLSALLGGELVVDRAELALSHLTLATTDDGALDLVAALRPPRPPAVATATRKAPARTPTLDAVHIHVAEVWLDLPGLQAHLRDLRLAGALPAAPAGAPPAGELDLVASACHATWNKARRQVGFDECRVAASVDGHDLTVRSLTLRQREEVLMAQGHITTTTASTTSRWRAWGRLGRHEADQLLPGSFPLGFDFDGLDLATDGPNLSGSLATLVAPRWSAGPLSADHVALAIARFTAAPGLLVPEMDLAVDHLAAARLEGLDWSFEGLYVPSLTGDLQKRLLAEAAGWSSSWTLPTGTVGPVDLTLAADLKLTGGRLEATVETPVGHVLALGTLKSSPLTKRTSFVADLRFRDVAGPLADALLHDLDDDQRAALGPTPRGTAELDVDVDRADRFSPWQTELEWALGRLDSAHATPPTAFDWDGYAWVSTSAPPEDTTP